MTRAWGGAGIALSFVFIATQIRLGFLCEMVVVCCLIGMGYGAGMAAPGAPWPQAVEALRQMQWLASHLDVPVTVDLADLRGYAYYSGTRFAIYVPGASDALVRGGRYDEVGAVFGRNRPAAGFSLDIKQLVAVVPEPQDKQTDTLVMIAPPSGSSTLLQSPSPAGTPKSNDLQLATLDYDEKGHVTITGLSSPGVTVRAYLDEKLAAEGVEIGEDGARRLVQRLNARKHANLVLVLGRLTQWSIRLLGLLLAAVPVITGWTTSAGCRASAAACSATLVAR